jgi:hypothetical protein
MTLAIVSAKKDSHAVPQLRHSRRFWSPGVNPPLPYELEQSMSSG